MDHRRYIKIQHRSEAQRTQRKLNDMFIHFFCLGPLGLNITIYYGVHISGKVKILVCLCPGNEYTSVVSSNLHSSTYSVQDSIHCSFFPSPLDTPSDTRLSVRSLHTGMSCSLLLMVCYWTFFDILFNDNGKRNECNRLCRE